MGAAAFATLCAQIRSGRASRAGYEGVVAPWVLAASACGVLSLGRATVPPELPQETPWAVAASAAQPTPGERWLAATRTALGAATPVEVPFAQRCSWARKPCLQYSLRGVCGQTLELTLVREPVGIGATGIYVEVFRVVDVLGKRCISASRRYGPAPRVSRRASRAMGRITCWCRAASPAGVAIASRWSSAARAGRFPWSVRARTPCGACSRVARCRQTPPRGRGHLRPTPHTSSQWRRGA